MILPSLQGRVHGCRFPHFSLFLLLVFFGITPVALADFPLVSHRYLADPDGIEYNGQLYIYCSNDDDNSTNGGYAMHSIVCISSSDLKNWTDHGVVFQAPQNASWASYSWAPTITYQNGLFYLYFGNNTAGIGVATNASPTGPFVDARGSALVNSSTPGASGTNQEYFDPCIFMNAGQPYLYFGGNGSNNARVIQLNTNMISVNGSATNLGTLPHFLEASYMSQYNGLYYFSYETGGSAGEWIMYGTNSNPFFGFTFVGDVLQAPNNNNNNHHSFLTFQGVPYIAYHNRYLAQLNGVPPVYKRNVCLDRLYYNADGTLQIVACTTNGLFQLKNFNPFAQVEAETMAQDSGIYTEPCSEGGMDVTSIQNGCWLCVRGVDFTGSGASNFTARVASAAGGGNIELHLDATNGYLIGSCPVPVTGSAQTWVTASCTVSNGAAKNIHDLYLRFAGGAGTNLFNINWWQFQPGSSNAPSTDTQFVLKTSDAFGSTSFNTIGNWVTNGTANSAAIPPAPGGAYNTGTFTLRTPTTNNFYTFGGDSLTLSAGAPATGGSLLLKGPNGGTVVINNLILAGGVLAQGVNSGLASIEWVAGNINVLSNSTVSGLGTTTRYIGISANITGTASLSNDCNVIYSGNNSGFTGQMIVGSGGTIQISDPANLGGNPGSYNSAQIVLNNGTISAQNSVTLSSPNSGITLATGGGSFTNPANTILMISNIITGTGTLTFNGDGTLTLTATNTYTGATVVNAGTVLLLSPKTGTGNISISDGATLDLTATGNPLTPANLTLGSSAGVTLAFDNITSTTTAPIAAGSLSSSGIVSIRVNSGSFTVGQSYPLFTWTSGTAPAVALVQFSGGTGNLSINGNTVMLNVTSANPPPATSVKFEAEAGALGSDWAISNSTAPAYITITTDNTGTSPSNATRVATYTIAFPASGSYQLYAHVLVGPAGASDDSLFYGNGFGIKNPTNSSDWILVNGLVSAGFTNSNNVVTGGGTAGIGTWKWINLSQFAPGPAFTVPAGNLAQTFQIGAREAGLDIDAFVFGLDGMTFTVSNLDAGLDGTPPSGGISTINWTDVRQRIDGFGAGAVFLDAGLDPIASTNLDTLFGTNNTSQLALSLLRIRIDPSTNWTAALSDAQGAVARGSRVFATPWTPPATMKTNNNIVGGALATNQYATYASYLNTFAGYMKSNGVSLAAVSIQNEPDFLATYESCIWSSGQFLAFFRTNAAAITNAPVMMPESFHYDQTLSDPTLTDPAAATNVSVIGGHLYGGTIQDYPNAHNQGKPTWMTEFLLNDQSIDSAIVTAQQINDCLTIGNMSAYIWWKTLGDSNGLVNASGAIQKRGYVMSQFSRFIRPGFNRIATTNTGAALVTAFRNTNSGVFALVAINPTSFTLTPSFSLTNLPATASMTPWITSANFSLAPQSSLTASNSSFTYTLPPLSLITFIGQLTNNPPSLAPVSNQTLNAGIALTLTNTATDPDLPIQSLTFMLLAGPTNATLSQLNPTNAIFRWRPSVSQAGTTTLVSIVVADNGSPSITATNFFNITVNALTNSPAFNSIAIAGRSFIFSITGPTGPDYTLQSSTNLQSWQSLLTSNSPVTPFTLTVTNLNNPAQFYRIQIGP